MAKKEHKIKHKTKTHKKKHKARAKGRKPSSGSGMSLDSIPKIVFSSAILRFGSGLAYFGIRKLGYDSPKIKIAIPAAAAFAYAKGFIPRMEGFYPIAIGQATDATIENVKFLKDIFDLKFMDKKPALPTAGMTPRSAAETARLIAANARQGLVWNKRGLVFTRKSGLVYRGGMSIAEKNRMASPSHFESMRKPKSGLTRDMRREA